MTTRHLEPFVLLLSGPSGAGKSATALAWAEGQPIVTACVSHDSVRTLIRSGFSSPETDRGDESARQWDLAIRVCAAMARRYLDAGVCCVVEAYRPPQPHDLWDEELAGLDVRAVTLMPSFAVASARNASRDGHVVGDHDDNYSDFLWCVEQYRPATLIDNSEMSVGETVAAIDACLSNTRGWAVDT